MDCMQQKLEQLNTVCSVKWNEDLGQPNYLNDPTMLSKENIKQQSLWDFLHKKMAQLDEKIAKSRWIELVLPGEELESLIDIGVYFCWEKIDHASADCQRFFNESLAICFTKLLTDDVINSWAPYIHYRIYVICAKFLKLCLFKFEKGFIPMLEVLAMVFNPNNNFHTFNAAQISKSVLPGGNISDVKLYARPSPNPEKPRGWLVDLINRFGSYGGIDLLLTMFVPYYHRLTIPIIHAVLRPLELCYEFLTVDTIEIYFLPIAWKLLSIWSNLTHDELQKKAGNGSIDPLILDIINAANRFTSRLPEKEDYIMKLQALTM